VRRRQFLEAAMLTSALARPAIAQKPRVLRFVPQGNLQNPDPIWTTTVIAANQGHDLGHAVRP
jgi:peptide/nickel transport system substrate-binding protein